jgi:hypothetical protein
VIGTNTIRKWFGKSPDLNCEISPDDPSCKARRAIEDLEASQRPLRDKIEDMSARFDLAQMLDEVATGNGR